MRKIIVIAVLISLNSTIFADSTSVNSEFYIGALLVGENKFHSSIGAEFGGGLRLVEQHFIVYDIGISRQRGGISDVQEPTNNTPVALGLSYLFTPLDLFGRVQWGIGFRHGLNRNEYNETDGYFGYISRITVGNRMIAFYVTGVFSTASIIDIFGGWPKKSIHVYNVSSGVRFSIGEMVKQKK